MVVFIYLGWWIINQSALLYIIHRHRTPSNRETTIICPSPKYAHLRPAPPRQRNRKERILAPSLITIFFLPLPTLSHFHPSSFSTRCFSLVSPPHRPAVHSIASRAVNYCIQEEGIFEKKKKKIIPGVNREDSSADNEWRTNRLCRQYQPHSFSNHPTNPRDYLQSVIEPSYRRKKKKKKKCPDTTDVVRPISHNTSRT